MNAAGGQESPTHRRADGPGAPLDRVESEHIPSKKNSFFRKSIHCAEQQKKTPHCEQLSDLTAESSIAVAAREPMGTGASCFGSSSDKGVVKTMVMDPHHSKPVAHGEQPKHEGCIVYFH